MLEGVLVLGCVFPKTRQEHFLFVGSETWIEDIKTPSIQLFIKENENLPVCAEKVCCHLLSTY